MTGREGRWVTLREGRPGTGGADDGVSKQLDEPVSWSKWNAPPATGSAAKQMATAKLNPASL